MTEKRIVTRHTEDLTEMHVDSFLKGQAPEPQRKLHDQASFYRKIFPVPLIGGAFHRDYGPLRTQFQEAVGTSGRRLN